ncbi:C13 family peptidase [Uliginosibacterium sp. H1]|uniref:C13 family peptidase n=1 Tax=Uliginosibacterium sp. H1 TaxID=3114757 RepID=UPI002E190E67|nr:C13 family peptidase [Uliginosibacterium sp. H1]
MLRTACVALLCLGLSACAALNPKQDQWAQRSDVLLGAQLTAATSTLAQSPPPKILLAAFAMHSDSLAFQGDTELFLQRFGELAPQAARLHLSNRPAFRELPLPFATGGTLGHSFATLGRQLDTDSLVVILISSHGNKNVLAVDIAGDDFPAISGRRLRTELDKLGNVRSIVIVSACFSGSLIPALEHERRIILTAASAERPSFGCQTNSSNTFFIDGLLRDLDTDLSLRQLYAQAQQRVTAREKAMKVLPSEPQMSVGAAMQELAERPLRELLAPAQKNGAP